MPTSLTEFYDLEKPELEASGDDWGRILNETIDKIDAAIRNCVHLASHPAFNTPLTANDCQLPILLPAQDGTVVGNVRAAATQAWVEARILFYMNKFLPVGTILLWYGQFGTVPAGWTFCDGTAGSPDLRGRFVLCANNVTPQILPGYKEGTLTPWPGEHVHQATFQFFQGSGEGPFESRDGAALYSGASATLPYAAQMYIMKYAAW